MIMSTETMASLSERISLIIFSCSKASTDTINLKIPESICSVLHCCGRGGNPGGDHSSTHPLFSFW